MAHTSENTTGFKAFTATAVAIGANLRVALDSDGKIAVSGAANDWIGTTVAPIAASGVGTVRLKNSCGSHMFTASAAVTRGNLLYPTAAGKVDDAGTTGGVIGFVANEAATADGDVIEGIPTDAEGSLNALGDGQNIVLGTTTGSKIGTAVTQKLGFYNVTPVVQPASANQTALTDNTGGSVADAILADGETQAAAFTDNTTGTTTTTLAAGAGVYNLTFDLPLAGITDADILTSFLPGHKFKILAFDFYTSVAVTTGAKASTINLEIGAVDVTGGVISLTSANCTPKGVKVAGTAVTAANTGSASDVISIEATLTTAFVEGEGHFVIRIQNMDTADAFAGLVTQSNNARTDIITQNANDAKIAELSNALRTALVNTGIAKGAA